MTDKDVKLVSTEELAEMDAQTQYLSPIFGSYASDVEMPVDKLNHDPIEPRIASEIIREYIGTEGNAHQNLCTFVQTYMEPEAAELMKETLEKNAIASRSRSEVMTTSQSPMPLMVVRRVLEDRK